MNRFDLLKTIKPILELGAIDPYAEPSLAQMAMSNDIDVCENEPVPYHCYDDCETVENLPVLL